jgi:predicted DNA-binding transcriptional regulator AlpA
MDTGTKLIQQNTKNNFVATYHGQDIKGFRVKSDGKKYYVSGVLSERKQKTKANGEVKWTRHDVAVTPGYVQFEKSNAKSIIVRCVKTQVTYRLTGDFREVTNANLTTVATASPLLVKSEVVVNEATQLTARPSKSLRDFQSEFTKLIALKAAGGDPDMRMALITAYLQESKASLYRKKGKTFPEPIKRGRGSYWPMSLIDQYKAGKYVGGGAA